MAQPTCSTLECDRLAHARGYCGRHYKQYVQRPREGRDRKQCLHCSKVLASASGRAAHEHACTGSPRTCTKCDEPHLSRGFCQAHYTQWRYGQGRPCEIAGCSDLTGVPGTARGMCAAHYDKWRVYGDPLHVHPDTRPSRWSNDIPRRYRARVAGVPVIDFTESELKARMSMWSGCWMCGSRDWSHVDHVKPISAGGPHCLSNLRPACVACNCAKGGQWPFAPL